MSAESTIRAGRRFQEARMPATVTIRRLTGRVLDDTTGEYTNTYDPIYAGKARIDFPTSVETLSRDMEGQILAEQRPLVLLPVDAPGSGDVAPNDEAVIDANPLDPAAVGMTIRITGRPAGSYATARRLTGEVLT